MGSSSSRNQNKIPLLGIEIEYSSKRKKGEITSVMKEIGKIGVTFPESDGTQLEKIVNPSDCKILPNTFGVHTVLQ